MNIELELEIKTYDLIIDDLYIEFPTRNCCIKYIHDSYPEMFCDKFLIDHLDYENDINRLLSYDKSERLCSNERIVYADLEWEYLQDKIKISENS